MSEVYWVTGLDGASDGEHNNAPAVIQTLATQAGIRPGWLDEIHWQSDYPLIDTCRAELAAAGYAETLPFFSWPYLAHLEHALLHARSRALILNDARLVIFGQQTPSAFSAVVLGNPEAVGRYNLMPRARLACRVAVSPRHRTETLSALRTALEKAGYDPEAVEWLALSHTEDPGAILGDRATFEGAHWLAMQDHHASLLARLNGLVQAIEDSGSSTGLLISSVPGHPVQATLVERV